jgi:cell division protein FtsB
VKVSSCVAASLVVSFLLFGFFLIGDRGFLEVRRQRQRLAALQADVSALARENERLEADVTRLRSDVSASEKIAREELNFVKPGDVVLVLPPGWEERVGGKPAVPAKARAESRQPR